MLKKLACKKLKEQLLASWSSYDPLSMFILEMELAECVIGRNRKYIEKHQPRLCCVIKEVSILDAVSLVKEFASMKGETWWLISYGDWDGLVAILVSMKSLDEVAKRIFVLDYIFSLSSLTSTYGCSFDFDRRGENIDVDKERADFYATPWDDDSNYLKEISSRWQNAILYRESIDGKD